MILKWSAVTTHWVREYSNGAEYLDNLNGVSWTDASVPRPLHRCKPQTRAFLLGDYVERCACGAVSFDGDGLWIERNSRKKRCCKRPSIREGWGFVEWLLCHTIGCTGPFSNWFVWPHRYVCTPFVDWREREKS